MAETVGLKRSFTRAAWFVFWLLAIPTVVIAGFALYAATFAGIVYVLGENVVMYGLLAFCGIGLFLGVVGAAWDLSGGSR